MFIACSTLRRFRTGDIGHHTPKPPPLAAEPKNYKQAEKPPKVILRLTAGKKWPHVVTLLSLAINYFHERLTVIIVTFITNREY